MTILLAEDDPGQANLILKNLKRANIPNPCIHASDGQETIDIIFKDIELPCPKKWLILLDLNMPVMDGYQVLEKLKSDHRTHNIPIIVLTTTDDPREVKRCYELGCNVYVTKPVDYFKFSQAIQNLGLFISNIQLPE